MAEAELDELATRLGRAEAEVARLRAVLRELPEAVLIVDGAGELQLANRRAEELLGQSFGAIARSIRDGRWGVFGASGELIAREQQGPARAVTIDERTLNERVEFERPDGERVTVDGTAVPVYSEDRIVAVVVIFRDVTARERRERAERDFVTNAAHELQTPLAAITSAIEVLQSGAKDRPADRDRFLGHIQRACDRLDRLTRALLVLARAQTRDEAPRREVIALEPLLRSIASGFPREHQIEVVCAHDLAVIANRPLLEQAIANLGQNALKHSRGRVVFSGAAGDGRVEIAVGDTGPGIPPDKRDRVFDRFYRSDDAVGEGFGLGLAIVAQAVRALGGELALDSSESGTTVSITLPAARILSE